jgi:hypothetical protein
MTPKDKAGELIYRFTFYCRECDYEDNARESALIAVDEILEELITINLEKWYYWQEVKQEIEKL